LDRTKDGYGNDDVGHSLALDGSNNILVTGYITNDNSKKELCVLKYNNSGTLLWDKQRSSAYQGDASGWKIIEDNGRIYVAGDYTTDNSVDIIALAYDSNGIEKWLKTFDGGTGEEDNGRHAEIGGSDFVYICGKVKENGIPKYVDIKYEEWERPLDAITANDVPVFVDNEIIIRFSPEVIIENAVNEHGRVFGTLSQFVENGAIEQMNSLVGLDLKGRKTIKIFTGMSTEADTSIARNGSHVKIKPLWSTLVLTLPNTLDELETLDTLNTLDQIVYLAEPNWIVQPDDDANDALFPEQYSLFENDP
jgi:hypothetical protein